MSETLAIEGGLLGLELIERLRTQPREVPGQRPEDFGLARGARLGDEIQDSFSAALAHWRRFARRREALGVSTGLTREQWVLPLLRLLGFEPTLRRQARQIGGASYAISHFEGDGTVPIHIAAFDQELHRRGRERLSPHALVQEYLNRSDALWGIVTNGRRLRILRDTSRIARAVFVEFDLEAIFEQELYADFALLFRIAHRTRFPLELARAHECWLERRYQEAVEEGGRVRERLREGVVAALEILGTGFLAHPDNTALRDSFKTSTPDATDYWRELLALVYRLLFLMTAEERRLLGLPEGHPERGRFRIYERWYAIGRLRERAEIHRGADPHGDLWRGLVTLFRTLDDVDQARHLGLAALDGDLFAAPTCCNLEQAQIRNDHLLEALWHLSTFEEREGRRGTGTRRRVRFAGLDVEELGSVYESLLDYHPVVDLEGRRFRLVTGSQRKQTGSYYTPDELVQELIRSALDPVVEERLDEAARMANGEWRGVPGPVKERFVRDVLPRLSGSGGLAGGRGYHPADLRAHGGDASDGTLRPYEPDSAGRGVDPRQHRGRVGATLPERIHPVPAAGERQPDRAGDASVHRGGAGAAGQGGGRPDPARPLAAGPAAGQSGTQPAEEELSRAWRETPFAIRHRLLAEHALLSLRILDPAAGSGHFLLAAMRRIGRRLAEVRTREPEPPPDARRRAERDVLRHCIHAVDKNPFAVDLCKVSLWIEGQVPGAPLSFLDAHIRRGDSLIGIFDLEVLKDGIPDEAYKPLSGDDKEVAKALQKRNRAEREASLFRFDAERELAGLARRLEEIGAMPEGDVEAVRHKREAFEAFQNSDDFTRLKLVCDLWCTAFFAAKTQATARKVPTTRHLWDALQDPNRVPGDVKGLACDLAESVGFFHWPLAFPEVMAQGGFDVVLGNPPWERIKLQEQEFFAARDPDIAEARNKAERERRIRELAHRNPELHAEFQHAKREADAGSLFVRASHRFPLTAVGDVNTYALFAELAAQLHLDGGRAGLILPTGIATDKSTSAFFAHLVASRRLVSLFDFENREGIFPAVDSRQKFCLMTLAREVRQAQYAFFLTRPEHLRDRRRRFSLTAEDIARINPNTKTAPIFRSRADAELTRAIYARVPVLVREDGG